MQHKLRLSLWTLMTSSFFVKIAIAEGISVFKESSLTPVDIRKHLEETGKSFSKVGGLKGRGESSKSIQNEKRTKKEEEESLFFKLLTNSTISGETIIYITDHDSESSGKKVTSFNYQNAGYSINNIVRDGGKLYIDEASVSRDTMIESGSIEFVRNLSNSEYAIVKKGGKQIVESGANAEGAKIYGGEQIVFGKRLLGNDFKGSSAYNTEIYAEGGMLGLQNVYSGGMTFDTKIMKGGIQNIDGGQNFNNGSSEDEDFTLNEGAFALNTELFKNGMQNILARGNASEVILYDVSTQKIYDTGYVDTLTINHQAQSWVYAGAILDKDTIVNDFGSLYLYAGNDEAATEVENLILNGEDTKLHSIAIENSGERSQIHIRNLSGNGRVIFTSTGSDKSYSQLNINHLSGQLHFYFNVSFAEHLGDYLLIKKSGSGYHTISVIDSGLEITNSSHKKLKLISDRSGNAHFTLTNSFGEKISTVDAGTYMYSLKNRKNRNTGKIWYLDANYTRDNRNNPLFSDFSFKPSAAPFLDVLTETTIGKGMVVSIADSTLSSCSEEANIIDNSTAESSISNTVQDGGKLYVYSNGFNLYTTIKSGGIEIIKTHGLSQDSTVYKGGKQKIKNGGKAEGTKIYGGEQFVSGKVFVVKGETVMSSAYDTVIFGQNEVPGYQNVYDGGSVFNTKIKEGGVQNLYLEEDLSEESYGSFAFNTEVFSGGEQNVLAGGEAIDVILWGNALQTIDLGGYVKNLIIHDQAKSWLHHGATLEGSTTVNDYGRIYLYAGAEQSRTEVEKIVLNGPNAKLYSIASNVDGDSSLVENLSGNGSVIFTSTVFNPHYSKLQINDLSGNLHFRFNINFAEQRGDYLLIKKGAGHHKISVIDSGVEVINFPLQKQHLVLELDLIHDQSGEAHFTLIDFSGEEIGTVDGGTYMYGLKQKEGEKESEKIWYLSAVFVDDLPFMKSVPQSRSKSPQHLSQNRPVSVFSAPLVSEERVVELLHLRESRRNLKPQSSASIFSTVSFPKAQAIKLSSSVVPHPYSDEHGRIILSTASQSLKDEISVRPVRQLQASSQSSHEISVSDFLTTPSTDAILSISVTPGLIFHNELQTARVGRKILDRNKKSSALWTYAIKSKESITTDHIDFKLEQTGIVLGISGLTEFTGGDFYIGGFGSYDQARVAHARGGTSSINIYGIGAYATYFDYNGWYLDSILKYNRYQNSLKAVSTNGLDIEGNYHQWVVGTSFEAGYRFKTWQNGWMQPYGQLTWLQVEGKKIALSNGMIGDIDRSTSLRSEVGVSLGYELGFGMDVSSMAYITAAWVRENRKGNHVTINEQHKFTTDLSGNVGKLGIGLSSFVSDKLKFYAQAHYLQGHKTKQSLQGIVGLRYSF
ncbi:BafA family autotransporter [Bartonella doshiae]|uniref:BafA family autotransporter n=2 Tax=Bartonella doshiae TaxID=33044 RepID=UPI001ABB86BF|nr:BafA family autotransporter [Bartonella doshiae]